MRSDISKGRSRSKISGSGIVQPATCHHHPFPPLSAPGGSRCSTSRHQTGADRRVEHSMGQGILGVAPGISMIHDPCTLLCDDNLQPFVWPGFQMQAERGRDRFFFSCFAFASVSVTGEWEREGGGREREMGSNAEMQQRRGGRHIQGSGTSKPCQLAACHISITSLPGFQFVTRTPELGVSQGRSLPGGIERSARFRSALAFVYNDLTSLCVIVPQAIFLPFRSL
jgi:hypothetical protein